MFLMILDLRRFFRVRTARRRRQGRPRQGWGKVCEIRLPCRETFLTDAMMTLERWLTAGEVEHLFRIPHTRMSELVKEKKLRFVLVGGERLFVPAHVTEDLIRQFGVGYDVSPEGKK